MWRATVAGHICADLRPKLSGNERIVPGAIIEVGPLDIRPGGSVANTGGDLAALGAQVLLVADLVMTSWDRPSPVPSRRLAPTVKASGTSRA